jgi:hypothetical protein
MSSVLREWPELREIRVEMRGLLVLDEASIASMKHALQTTRASQVRLVFDGYDARMAASLLRGGVSAAHLGAPRQTPPATSHTVH